MTKETLSTLPVLLTPWLAGRGGSWTRLGVTASIRAPVGARK